MSPLRHTTLSVRGRSSAATTTIMNDRTAGRYERTAESWQRTRALGDNEHFAYLCVVAVRGGGHVLRLRGPFLVDVFSELKRLLNPKSSASQPKIVGFLTQNRRFLNPKPSAS